MERNIRIKWTRLLILIFVILVSATKADAQQKWDGYGPDFPPLENNGESDTNTTFYSVSHPAANIVYLSSGKNRGHFRDSIPGILWKSYDNGENWQIIYTSDSTFFLDLFFYDENYGLATRTRLIKENMFHIDSMMLTTDGGVSWKAIPSKPVRQLQYISKDSLLGKSGGKLLLSTDGGMLWDTIFSGSFSSFSYVDGCIYVMQGTSHQTYSYLYPGIKVFKSSNYGKWWIELTSHGFPMSNAKIPYSLTDMYFYRNGHGVLVGTEHIYTKDDFKTHERIKTLGEEDVYYSSKFLKSGYRIVACSHDWKLYFNVLDLSKDFGRHRGTYQLTDFGRYDLKTYSSFNIDACEEDTTFFVIALPYDYTSDKFFKSLLYRVTPSDFDSLNLVPLDVPVRENIVSVAVSPNPATEKITVKSSEMIEKVELFDMSGNRVAFYNAAGTNLEERFDVSRLAGGTYVVKTHTRKGVSSAKFVKY